MNAVTVGFFKSLLAFTCDTTNSGTACCSVGVVADLAEEVILGQDWLQAYNPQIDWQKRTVSLASILQAACLSDFTF